VWTVAILRTYVALHLEEAHGTWGVPWWLVTAEYGAALAGGRGDVRSSREEAASRVLA